MSLSVIIPTRDRPERLRCCLESLRGAVDAEIVVVDDGSDPPLAATARDVRCVRLEGVGLNEARNRGAEAASGRILAFLDDDTVVCPGWLEAVRSAFASTGCDALGGRVTLALEGDAPPWLTRKLRRYLAEFELGPEPRWLDSEPVPVGANCAVTREAYEAAGGFLAGLDRVGTSLLSNGDTEFFRRLQRRGCRIRYEPRAQVEHCVPQERLTSEFFRRRAYAQGRSDAVLAPTGSVGREFLRRGRAVPIAARGVLAGRGAITAAFWLQYCRGRVDGVRAGRA
jgi:glycosyltransferase involved in cell wall biosynthesis